MNGTIAFVPSGIEGDFFKVKLLINNGKLTELFFSTRGKLLNELKKNGYEITLSGKQYDCEELIDLFGVEYIETNVNRTSLNPVHDIKLLLEYKRLIKNGHYDMVHSYTVKPNIYGSIAARIIGINKIYPTVNGLGYAFTEVNSFKSICVRQIQCLLYWIAFQGATKVLFQNQDDADDLIRRRVINIDKCVIVSGSGIDLEDFKFREVEDTEHITFLIATRLLITKGVRTFCEAAKIVKEQRPNTEFIIAGAIEQNRDGFSREELDYFVNNGIVKYLGYVNNMNDTLIRSSVFVLPSYYREGVPHAILEAMSTGRAIITCNSPGCKETIKMPDSSGKGKNGFLIKPKDSAKLAEIMLWLIDHPTEIKQMGIESRKYAEEKFEVNKVNRSILEAMGII